MALAEIEKQFAVTRSDNLKDFIGCRIEKNNNKVLLSQPVLVQKMLKVFGPKIEKMRDYETPASSGTHVIRCDDDKAQAERQRAI